MFLWIRFPFVRYVFWLIIGILLYDSLVPLYFSYALIVLFACMALILTLRAFRRGGPSLLVGLSISLFLIALGWIRAHQHRSSNEPGHFMHHTEFQALTATLRSNEEEKSRTYKSLVEVEAFKSDDEWKTSSGKLLVYRAKGDSIRLKFGDRILLKAYPKRIRNAGNPNEFDYSEFMSRRNVYHQTFAAADDWVWLGSKPGSNLWTYVHKSRNHFSHVLSTYIAGQEERSVAKALLLGAREELTDELKQAYAGSGAMHILAVSGLHVGIIFLIVQLLSKAIPHMRRKLFLLVFGIIILWAYAAVTGLSSSVTRATIMFTFLLVARAINRDSDIYNTLCIAAFFILLIEPNQLFQIGFQLSFTAVLSIVYFYPKIYPLLYLKNPILDYLWKLVSVTVAVQLLTFPISLYYFHEFPFHGVATNLVAVPAAFVIVSGGIMLFAFGPFEWLARLIGNAIEYVINFVNSFIYFIDTASILRVENVHLGVLGFWIIMAAIACLIFFVESKKFYVLAMSMALITVFFVREHANASSFNGIVIYNNHQEPLVEFLAGRQGYVMPFENELGRSEEEFILKPAHQKFGTDQYINISEEEDPDYLLTSEVNQIKLISFQGKLISILKALPKKATASERVKVDLIYYIGSEAFTLKDLKEHFEYQRLVILNKKSLRSREVGDAINNKSETVHCVRDDGAYIWKW